MKSFLFTRAFVFCASLVLFFLVLEVGTRVWIEHFASRTDRLRYSLYGSYPDVETRLSPHHYLNYVPTPNYEVGLTSHNSMGYRGREFSRIKPGGIFRIVALGGSSTYTEFVRDNAKTFPRLLETELGEKYAYERVEIINAGVPGYNSWESLINLEFRVLDLDPDLILIYHGTNDVHTRLVKPGSYRSDNSGRRKHWAPRPVRFWEYSAFGRLISRLTNLTSKGDSIGSYVDSEDFVGIDKGQYRGMDLLRQHPPIFFERNLTSMVSVARGAGAQVLLATWAHSPHFEDYASRPTYQQGFREGNEVVRSVAQRLDVPLFDFSTEMPQDKRYWSDGRHVNEEGAALKAKLFGAFLHEQHLIRASTNPRPPPKSGLK